MRKFVCVVGVLMCAAIVGIGNKASADDYYVCSPAWRFPAGDKQYFGGGNSISTAMTYATHVCRQSNTPQFAHFCNTTPVNGGACRMYDGCRVLRTTGPRDHHHRGCVSRGYLDYDPRPEKGPYKVGVCFKSEECRDPRPGDPF